MAEARWAQLERLFHEALAAVAAGRSPDVARLAGGSDSLADELRGLLRHAGPVPPGPGPDGIGPDDDTLTIERRAVADGGGNAADAADAADPTLSLFGDGGHADPLRVLSAGGLPAEWGASAIGQRIGGFTLLRPLGAGGMGMVFVAEQERPRRTVALKVIRPSLAGPSVVRRFEREAQLLGRLNHPGIAQVYAAGVSSLALRDGRAASVPFIAMELIDGPDLTGFAGGGTGDPRPVVELVAQACDAVQHAHVRGVIHRDLKPANILVAAGDDGRPAAKVVDFGVARQAADDVPADARAVEAGAGADGPREVAGAEPSRIELTRPGRMVGTLAFMPPEQAAGGEVDGRGDVYALGAVLYHALARRPPVDVTLCTLAEAARRIAEADPAPLGALDPRFRGDVEAVVAKALAKDPADRYQSPAELALDCRRWLAGQPVEARRESRLRALRRRTARYRALVAVAAAAAVVTSGVAGYAVRQQRLEAAASRRAELARGEADLARDQAEAATARASAAAAALSRELTAARVVQGRLLTDGGELAAAERPLWDEHLAHPDLPAARWALLELYRRTGCVATLRAHATDCRAIAVAPDGSRFVTGAHGDAALRVWSLPDGRPLGAVATGLADVRAAAFVGPDAVAVAGLGGAAVVRLDAGPAVPIEGGEATSLAVVGDGSAVAVGGADGVVRVHDLAGHGPPILLAPRPPAKALAAAGGATPAPPTPSVVRAVAYSPARRLLAAGWQDGRVALWEVRRDPPGDGDARGGALRLSAGPAVAGHARGACNAIAFDAAGARLATGSSDATVRLWDPADGSPLRTIRTNDGTARAVAFHPADGTLTTVGFWRTQRFDPTSGDPRPDRPATGPGGPAMPSRPAAVPADGGGFAVAFSADGRFLVSAGLRGVVRVWAWSPPPPETIPVASAAVTDLAVTDLAVSAAGGGACRVVAACADGTLAAFDRPAAGGPWRRTLDRRLDAPLTSVCLVPGDDDGGGAVVAARADGAIDCLDARTGGLRQRLTGHPGVVRAVRASGDGRTLVSAGADPFVRVWRRGGTAVAAPGDPVADPDAAATGWRVVRLLRNGSETLGVAVAPGGGGGGGGGRVVTTVRPDRLRVWSLSDGRLLGDARVEWTPWTPAVSPDGGRVAAGTWGRHLALWDAADLLAGRGDRPAALEGHAQMPVAQAFDASGRLLASGGPDGTVRLWDASPESAAPSPAPPAPAGLGGSAAARLRLLATFDAAAGAVTGVAFLPAGDGGSTVAAAYADGAVRLWDLHAADRAVANQAAYQRSLRPGR